MTSFIRGGEALGGGKMDKINGLMLQQKESNKLMNHCSGLPINTQAPTAQAVSLERQPLGSKKVKANYVYRTVIMFNKSSRLCVNSLPYHYLQVHLNLSIESPLFFPSN